MNRSLELLEQGRALADVAQLAERELAAARERGDDAGAARLRFVQQLVASMQGHTHAPGSLDDDRFDVSESLAAVGADAAACRVMQEVAAVTFGDHTAALAAARAVGDAASQALAVEATHHLHHALALIALLPDATPTQRAQWLPLLEQARQRLRQLADGGAGGGRHALVSAEMIRIGIGIGASAGPAGAHDLDAMRLYEQAIESARSEDHVHTQALAHELAARLHRERGLATGAEAHRREACACYARWGADAKVRQLEAQQLRSGGTPAADAPLSGETLALFGAAQAIVGDILLDHLLKIGLRTLMEYAGAHRGFLFLLRDDELMLAAEGRVEGEQVRATLHSGLQPVQGSGAPAAVVDEVRRSRVTRVLDAAQAAKSALCLPIQRRSELIGVLYLENALIAQAFSPARVAALELLAGQAAIALENAQLYADLKLENWEAETALLEREAHLRRLVDSNIIGIFFWDFDGSILDANDAFLQITGYTRSDLEEGRMDWAAMTPPEYAEADRNAAEELRRHGTTSQYEKEYINKDGTRTPVLIGAALIGGQRQTGIAFVLDQTERKRADAELRARQAADAANEAKSQFLANMSHELRTPLNAILGYAQLLLNDAGRDERTVAGLETIRQSGDLLLTLINDVLDVAAIESGRMALYPEAVDLPALLNAVVDIVRVKAVQKNLLLVLHLSPALPASVQVDEKRLRQVLLNLLSNAVKFTDAGEVQLRVDPLGAIGATVRLRFEVRDSGIGIDTGVAPLDSIFEPFVQAPDVQRRFGGTGLGLSISRQLLGLMGSEIQVDSRVGQGSCFAFELELPVDTGGAQPASAAPRRIISGYAGPRRRVLVVDDVVSSRMALVDLLGPLGFEVFAADNGQTGVELAQTLRPDLILMDAVMPMLDGLEATRRLRALPPTRQVPIVIVSASASADDQRNGLEVGANAFLPKPLDMQRLLALIGSLLRLSWLPGSGDGVPADAAAAPLVAPPLDELEALYQLAKAGNMRRIRESAERLAGLDPAYGEFSHQLLLLAGRFESRAILDLVTRCLQQSAPPAGPPQAGS